MSSVKLIVDDSLRLHLEKTLPGQIGGGAVAFGCLIELQTLNSERSIITTVPTPLPEGKSVWRSDDPPDEVWISEHAAQVARMLIGGVVVAGFYINAPESYISTYMGSIEYISKLLIKRGDLQEPIFLSWSHQGARPAFRRYFSEKKSTLTNEKLSFKYQKVPRSLVESSWALSSRPLTITRFTEAELKDFIDDFVEDERKRLDSALMMPQPSKTSTAVSEASLVEIFADISSNVQEMLVSEVSSHLVAGTLHARCVVPSGLRSPDVFKYLKRDICKSLATRLELISEKIQATLGEANQKSTTSNGKNHRKTTATPAKAAAFSFPKRVYFRAPEIASIGLFCDYMDAGESFEDIRARTRDLLGFEANQAASKEKLQIVSQEELSAPAILEKEQKIQKSSSQPTERLGNAAAGVFLFGAIFVGALCALIFVLLFGSK